MAKSGKGIKDVGNYRFFIFSTTPNKVNVTASSVCTPAQPSTRGQGKTRQYGNIMWDPRVCRGMYVTSSLKNARTSSSGNTPSSRCDLPQKKKLAPQKSTLLQKPAMGLATTVKRRAVSIFSNTSSERGRRSRSVTPPPLEGRFHVIAQTDPYFEPLEDDEHPGENIQVQTEEVMDTLFIAKLPSHFSPISSAIFEDKGIQCELWGIVDINKAIRPVSDNLTRLVIEQALKEIMDEFELESLIMQQNRFKQILSDETLKGEAVRRNFIQTKAVKEKDEEYIRARREHEAHHLLTVINFSSNYLLDFAEKSMDKFGEEWQNINVCEPIKCQFREILDKDAGVNLRRVDVSKDLADDIIKRVVKCEGDALLKVPVNSVMNIKQLEPMNGAELPGEYEYDLPFNTTWNADILGSKKSVSFHKNSVTESETSGSQNENDTD